MTEGRKLRDEGIATVLENEDEDWRIKAERFLSEFSGQEITCEEFKIAAQAFGIEPNHYNSWGGFWHGLIKRGRLESAGKLRQRTLPKAHADWVRVWLVN